MCDVLPPPPVNPTAVKYLYTISYQVSGFKYQPHTTCAEIPDKFILSLRVYLEMVPKITTASHPSTLSRTSYDNVANACTEDNSEPQRLSYIDTFIYLFYFGPGTGPSSCKKPVKQFAL
jgi:hypothetical protein